MTLRKALSQFPPPELARLLSDLPIEDHTILFRVIPRELAADTFHELPPPAQEALLKSLGDTHVAKILNEMSPDDRTQVLEELPAPVIRRLLNLLSPPERAIASSLLGYPENSVGRLMTPEYVDIKEGWTVSEVLDHIRKWGQDSETLSVVYITDGRGALIDDIDIRDILLSPPGRRISAIADHRFVSLKATDDQESAVAVFKAHGRVALPVTDTSGVLIGIVTIDDVLDVAEEEATEDFHKIAGSGTFTEPYLDLPLLTMARKRGGWLMVLFVSEMLTTTAMAHFEHEIARAVILAVFIPLIISTGGNSGSQAATLVVRAMAIGEVGLRHWWRIMRRELACGMILGAMLGACGFVRIALWTSVSSVYGEHWPLIGTTVALSLVGVTVWGTLSGSMLPLVIKRLKMDPATASAPFVATIVDVAGILLYFGLAMLLLKGTLL
ncbi:MAG: magnesium transporter [Elusimicrobiota bacterium]